MSIALNLYYTGKNGGARRFVEEMERSGTADLIRAEEGGCSDGSPAPAPRRAVPRTASR